MAGEMSNHVAGLIGLVSFLASVAGFFFWRMISRMENKLDVSIQDHVDCRVNLPKEYVRREDIGAVLGELKADRLKRWDENREEHSDIWGVVNSHAHDKESGRVVRLNSKKG